MSIMPFSQEGEVSDGKVVGFVNHKRDINIIFAVRASNFSKTNIFSSIMNIWNVVILCNMWTNELYLEN